MNIQKPPNTAFSTKQSLSTGSRRGKITLVKKIDQDSLRIGTSGWSYKEWEGVFYPSSKTPKLTFFSNVFNTAEVDSTFYALPSKGMVLGWARNTPKHFEFSLKLPKTITHEKELDLRKGTEIDLLDFLDLLEPLREAKKLGPLLIQLPPRFGASKKSILEEFLEALPKKDYYKFAIEFRNKSWLKEKDRIDQLLRRFNVARTIVDEPLLPIDLTPTADYAFIRWHGKGERPWYNYRYSEKELEPWVEKVETELKQTKKVYGYFNNHFHGFAIENSLQFLDKIEAASEKQKEMLSSVSDFINGVSNKPLIKGQKTLGEFKSEQQ